MSSYPISLDSDQTIQRIDDNLSQIGGEVINQIREAIFAIEGDLGLQTSGSAGTLASRLNVSLNADGSIKTSALSSAGLVTLPIDNAQIGTNAGIEESKLDLNYSTTSLHTRISAAEATLTSLATFASAINSNLRIHVAGSDQFLDGTLARHVASHIDLNDVPSDSRDSLYIWAGLKDKDGAARSADTVAEALLEINNDLIGHENSDTDTHPATSITVDTSDFFELTSEANTAQKAFNELDNAETLRMGLHRATMHDNGVNRTGRSAIAGGSDGYSQNIVPPTLARAFHIESPATGPVENNVTGDDLIAFMPDNTNYVFDSQFAQVKPGDIIRINYGTGFEAVFTVDEIRHNPNIDWVVRINNINLCSTDGYTCYARVDRPLFTDNTAGVFACALANNDIDGNILSSVIVGNPRGAMALGNGFEPAQLDGYHYNLYLNLYPTGDPSEKTINLPAIDVTGNQGGTPGAYTIENIVTATNNALRTAGYNYRFIAFAHKGNFGIMLADYVDNASFSIVSGTVSGTTLIEGSFTNNVVGDVVDGRDALGLGGANAAWASPDYTGTFTNTGSAVNFYTKVIPPLKSRNAIINGVRRDDFPTTYGEIGDGYWEAEITSRVVISTTTVEVTYTVDRDLSGAPLLAGKTIVVAPIVDVNDGAYLVQDYGRFIIKSVTYTQPCGDESAQTLITVINGIHGTGDPDDSSSAAGLSVRLYFSDDSVSFNQSHVKDAIINSNDFLRVHEIFLDEEGHSFSHERARMDKQGGTSSLLNTSVGWSFRRVSEKLQGFRDDETSTDFSRFIRLYIINYNSSTGEFDGYIGKRVLSVDSITNYGRVVRSRKNIPVKFYDHTNIDYIEVQYNETGSSTTAISYPRYVDIEVFPTLSTNDEYFKIASVETDIKAIVNVIDEREFGTISEKNFSSSAISFIEAGNRLLHGNGVFYGLDYKGTDSADSDSGLLFNGGSALVNGKVVVANNGKVNIPLLDAGLSILYGICLDIDGNFVPVLLSSATTWPDFAHSRKEMFVSDESGLNTYLVRSSTFDDLTNKETDLVLLAIVNVSSGLPITINSVSDARRFVYKESSHISLVWSENDDSLTQNEGTVPQGHFTSFEQIKTFIKYTDHRSYLIKLKGEFVLDSSIDLTEIDTLIGTIRKTIIFDGSEGCSVYVTSDVGFVLTDCITFRDVHFRYQPDAPASSGLLHLDVNSGCLYCGTGVTDVKITNCVFKNEQISGERFPFINFKVNGNLSNISITKNYFIDSTGDSGRNAVIGFSPYAASNTLLMEHVLIEDNHADQEQKIAVLNSYTRGDTTSGGIIARHVIIRGNYFDDTGGIGFMVRSFDENDSLIIENNSAHVIIPMDDEGNNMLQSGTYTPQFSDFPNGTGKIFIRGNRTSAIGALLIGEGTGPSVVIESNNIDLQSSSDLIARYGFVTGTISGISISQVADSPPTDPRFFAHILNNTITGRNNTSQTHNLYYGIRCFDASVIIKGNTIHGFTNFGISNFSPNIDGYSIISNNMIFRDTESISGYIEAGAFNTILSDNILDSTTINGSSTATISTPSPTAKIYINNNVNYIESVHCDITTGGFNNLVDLFVGGSISSCGESAFSAQTGQRSVFFNIPSTASSFSSLNWVKSINEIIPPGATLKGITTQVYVNDNTNWASGSVTMYILERTSSSAVETSNTYTVTSGTSGTLTLSDLAYRFDSSYYVKIVCSSLDTSTNDTIYFTKLVVTYTF